MKNSLEHSLEMRYQDFVKRALREGHAKGATQRDKMRDAARLWREFKSKHPNQVKGAGKPADEPPVAGDLAVEVVSERPKAAMAGGAAKKKRAPPKRRARAVAPAAPSRLEGGDMEQMAGGEMEGGSFLSHIPIVGPLLGLGVEGNMRVAGEIPSDMVGAGVNPFQALQDLSNPLGMVARTLTGGCADCDEGLQGGGAGERIAENIGQTLQNLMPAAMTLVPLLI